MKSLYAIEMDYQKAIGQANELDQLASQLETQANDNFPEIIRSVSDAWQGDNANKYVGKANKLPGKIKGAATDLRNIASTIRTVAENTYKAEKAAYEIAQKRDY